MTDAWGTKFELTYRQGVLVGAAVKESGDLQWRRSKASGKKSELAILAEETLEECVHARSVAVQGWMLLVSWGRGVCRDVHTHVYECICAHVYLATHAYVHACSVAVQGCMFLASRARGVCIHTCV